MKNEIVSSWWDILNDTLSAMLFEDKTVVPEAKEVVVLEVVVADKQSTLTQPAPTPPLSRSSHLINFEHSVRCFRRRQILQVLLRLINFLVRNIMVM